METRCGPRKIVRSKLLAGAGLIRRQAARLETRQPHPIEAADHHVLVFAAQHAPQQLAEEGELAGARRLPRLPPRWRREPQPTARLSGEIARLRRRHRQRQRGARATGCHAGPPRLAAVLRRRAAGRRRRRAWTRLRRCGRNPAAARPPDRRRALHACLALIPLDMVRETRRFQVIRTVIETPTFQKQAEKLWSEDERLAFIDWIVANPLAGDVIPGADGARKVRWSRAGSGKSGGRG